MFDELKRAWRDAVRNFRSELHGSAGDEPDGSRSAAMRDALDRARRELRRLEADVRATRRAARSERDEEAVCRRRESLAAGIGDQETARIARRYAARHAERAAVLERKLEALRAQRDLWRRDLAEMESALRGREADAAGELHEAGAARGNPNGGSRSRPEPLDDLDPDAGAFQELERAARERAAAERLEELKRRGR